jgi:hypothetical protein
MLARHLPTEWFERPKQGFGMPVAEWFRGELRDILFRCTSRERTRRRGLWTRNGWKEWCKRICPAAAISHGNSMRCSLSNYGPNVSLTTSPTEEGQWAVVSVSAHAQWTMPNAQWIVLITWFCSDEGRH